MRETRKLSELRTDGGTQARAGLDEAKVEEYHEALAAGEDFPALVAFYDGQAYWLADGFHRHAAAKLAGIDQFLVDVKQGTRRDAVLYAVGANATHGLPRTTDDKRRAVETLLRDEEWVTWSDREIARRCKVSPTFVGKIRGEVVTVHVDSEPVQERTYITRHGTPATMDTSKIGNGAAAYEEIHSLQYFVITWIGKAWQDDLSKQVEILEHMKLDKKHAYWTGLGLDLGRAGKVFRKSDLVQALNNALDTLRNDLTQPILSQSSEPAQETLVPHPFLGSIESPVKQEPDLVDIVTEFALGYKDWMNRDWAQIENPSHTNGTFWQRIKKWLELRDVVYESDAKLKIAIKRAFAKLKNEPEPDLKYWEKFVEGDKNEEQDPDQEKHWGLSNGMAFWTAVEKFHVDKSRVLEFLQLGASRLTDLNMTKQEAFDRLIYAPTEPVDPTPVLNGEQTQQPTPAPKPRIASYVMGHFNTANEALKRILTAIPKSQEQDVIDFMTMVHMLEQWERRIGQEYELV